MFTALAGEMMETLRIGMFSWESLHSVKVGGISPHVSALSETLADKGHEVHVFTRIGDKSPYDEINGVHYQRCIHDEYGGIIDQMGHMCNSMMDRYRSVSKLFGSFDVIHCHDWHPCLTMGDIKNNYGTPYVMTYHSTEWGRNGNSMPDWWEGREICHREWLCGYESDEVIATSPNLKAEIQHLYQIPEYKISIVPNAIYPNRMRKNVDAGEVKKRYGIHPLAPMILFIGRMAHQKGPDLLVRAVPHVLDYRWDVKFIFAGEGEMRFWCENMSHDLMVSDACQFLGYTPDEDVKDLLNACNMLCVPSRNEPFGIVVLEAWSVGKPVIGTDAVGIIDNFVNGIKAQLYPESIAWCINNVIDRQGALDRMGEQGRALVETVYNWDSVADKTVEVYKKAINRAL